jgi:hypothetical protein
MPARHPCGLTANVQFARRSIPEPANPLGRPCFGPGDQVYAARIAQKVNGSIKGPRVRTGIGFIYNPFSLTDLDPVPHNVTEERFSRHGPWQADVSGLVARLGVDRDRFRSDAQ